jgi:membrane protease YdiL (CAAX protease family)
MIRVSPQDLFSRGDGPGRLKKALQLPLVRVIIALVALSPAVIVFNLVYGKFIGAQSRWTSWPGDVGAVIIVGLTVYCYRLYVKVMEKRPAYEIQRRGSGVETGIGFALGAMLVVLTWLVILPAGSYEVENTNPTATLIHAFFIFGLLAFFEELVFRGILLRLFEEWLGTWLSIVLVAVGFGAVHLVHEEATMLSSTAIALSDLVLSGAFVLTRKIWLSWGIHWGWNFAQDGVLGMPNSSVDVLPSLFNPEISGPTWLTGGVFGIELSVIGVVLNIVAGLVLIKIAIDRGQILRPIWKRSP